MKDELGALLEKYARRIVVLIDDTDRLALDELRQLFRLIKAVADFPNVLYVVALDPSVAREALAGTFGVRANEYLQKIVQLPYELPLPERSRIRALFFERLEALLGSSTDDDEFEETYWTEVFIDCVDPFLGTPRDVSRLVNVLRGTYLSVRGEVNLADFVAIATLQTFESDMWDVVRRNPDGFAGASPSGLGASSELERLESFYGTVLGEAEAGKAGRIERSLARLFPRFSGVRGRTTYGADWETAWRRQRRVASPTIFPLFFQQAPPPGHLTRAEVRSLLDLACDETGLREAFLQLAAGRAPDGATRLPDYLERLRDHAQDVPHECIENVVRVLFDVGDQLLIREDEGGGMFSYGNDIRIMQLLYQLLRRVDEQARFEMIQRAVADGGALGLAAHEIAVYAQEHGEMGASGRVESDQTVTKEHLEELKALLVDKVRAAAGHGALLGAPSLGRLLYRWQDWGGEDEPRLWANEVAKEDDALVAVLEAFLGEVKTQGSESGAVRREYRLDPKSVEPFIDPAGVIERVRALATGGSFSGRRQAALEQFIRGYEMRLEGKDPNWRD